MTMDRFRQRHLGGGGLLLRLLIRQGEDGGASRASLNFGLGGAYLLQLVVEVGNARIGGGEQGFQPFTVHLGGAVLMRIGPAFITLQGIFGVGQPRFQGPRFGFSLGQGGFQEASSSFEFAQGVQQRRKISSHVVLVHYGRAPIRRAPPAA